MSRGRYYTMMWEKDGKKEWGFYANSQRCLEAATKLINEEKVQTNKIFIYKDVESYTFVRNDWSLSDKALIDGPNFITVLWEEDGKKEWVALKTETDFKDLLEKLKEKNIDPRYVLIYSRQMLRSNLGLTII